MAAALDSRRRAAGRALLQLLGVACLFAWMPSLLDARAPAAFVSGQGLSARARAPRVAMQSEKVDKIVDQLK
eukprot:CAMPEP_0170595636 /NCGR_PEP_ID=MMETSP0224-20130122/14671_1 /TAXON_ID=285029 /ORGANISM="Togula jolla, Strain CCCM 725" /LENGTH=71 /DNA_ID=CAMNT_0010919837 /DNA_START=60 /DNA_END=272 /DNA_ORIENTATION=+